MRGFLFEIKEAGCCIRHMIKKIYKIIAGHKIITFIVIVVLAVGGYWGYKNLTKTVTAASYVMATVEKGTLIVSISGSGQVQALDQLDIKAPIAGELNGIYAKEGQEVKNGQLLFSLDAGNSVSAENALAQAQRSLQVAKDAYDNIGTDSEQTVADAYQTAYESLSSSFFKLSSFIDDLKAVLGSNNNESEYVESYRKILGSNSSLVNSMLNDYSVAKEKYNASFEAFKKINQNSSRADIYQALDDTLSATRLLSQSLESARHMYDAIETRSYAEYYVSSVITKMQPKIESDVSAVYSAVSSMQSSINNIDTAVKEKPNKITDAKIAYDSALQNVAEKQTTLDELKNKLVGANIRATFNGVVASVENIKIGDEISTGTTLATVITKQKVAEITLNEIDVAKVKVGQKATLTFDALDNITAVGEVIEVATLGSTSQNVVGYTVKIGFDAGENDIKPGYSVSVAIVTNVKQNVLIVPNSAVKKQGEVTYAQTSDLKQQDVQAGISNDTMTEIISGLNEGDQVVSRTVTSTTSTASSANGNATSGVQGIMRLQGGR
jgi:HlyD family secretion protein